MIRQAVILCGANTRPGVPAMLVPEPPSPAGAAPFLDVIAAELARRGIRRIALLADRAERAVLDFAEPSPSPPRFDIEITVVPMPEAVGSGGALWSMRNLLDDRFLLVDGHSWFDIDLPDLARWLDADERAVGVAALRRRRPPPESPDRGCVSGGVYALRRTALLDHLGPVCSFELDIVPHLARDGLLLGIPFDGDFIDLRTPRGLARARELAARP